MFTHIGTVPKELFSLTALAYFDLYYNNTVLHFIPSEISFMKGNMIINHNHSSITNSLIIRFKIVESDDAKTGITEKNVYINKLIGDGLEGGKIKFNTNVSIKTKTNGGTNYVIDFTDCGTIPIQKLKEDIKNGGAWPTGLTNTGNSIALKPNSFATDEIVCDEGTINSVADKTKKSYEAKVAGNIGISFGLGFLVLTAVVFGITMWKPMFNTGTEWFGGWDKQFGYNIIFVIAFLLSFSCFMGYGGVLSSGSGSTADLTGLLWTAIVSFLIFVFMVGYKMAVLTKPPAAAAAPAAAP
jgi:hypothetical protein